MCNIERSRKRAAQKEYREKEETTVKKESAKKIKKKAWADTHAALKI